MLRSSGGCASAGGALGVSLGWRYLDPYGYINTTNLVGVGPCNNPFFGADEKKKVLPILSPDRGGFGNHAFVAVGSGNILDACAGPHVGSETPARYVTASIDTTPALYGGGFRPGTAGDIIPGAGVTDVS